MSSNERLLAGNEDPLGILLVDDDERVLKFISRMLYSFGHDEVYEANSAEHALDIWKERSQKIWLVISDFIMPNMTGDLMVLEMLQQRSDVKVLFISGNDPCYLNSKIPLHAGRNFLQKPFSMHDLRQAIQNLAHAGTLRRE